MVIIKKAALYWFTLKYLKPVQVLSRLWQKISIAKKRPVPEPVTCRLVCVQQADFIAKPNSILSSNQFVFLNQEKATQTAIDWNDKDIPKLWLYNLHYHDGLGCLVTLVDTKRTFINRWIKENPVGSGNGWEPYPLSLRIVNWVKWLLDGDKPVEGMITSLVSQTHSLGQQLEYHLLGNHLFANAKALVFVGCFFDGPQAEKWLQKGLKILYKEIPEQFLEDGAHFELSTTYQATLTEDLLDIINILQAYGQKVSKKWKETACSAVRWQKNMTRPDGLPPLFNDAAYGISPSLTDIDSYAKRLDLKVETLELEALIDLQPSGYFRYEGDNYSFFGDAGQIGPDYIPGHAHCDMLNFELFANGQPMIVDTGISTYEVCEQRHYERSTAAHNTVQLGDVEQSEIWSAFRVARRAKIIERSAQENVITAAYKNYNGAYVHRRKFEFDQQQILLTDSVEGNKGSLQAKVRFHLHPKITPKLAGDFVVLGSAHLRFVGAKNIVLAAFDYAPEFNELVPSICVEVTFDHQLETRIVL